MSWWNLFVAFGYVLGYGGALALFIWAFVRSADHPYTDKNVTGALWIGMFVLLTWGIFLSGSGVKFQ